MRNFLSDGDLLTVFVVCSQVQMQELMKCIQRKSMLLWIKASGKSIHVFSTNQLCPVITSIEIYVRTWERSWRNVYAGPLQQHSPLTSCSVIQLQNPDRLIYASAWGIQREGEAMTHSHFEWHPRASNCFAYFPLVTGKLVIIYIYAFSRRFYPKRLTVHSGYTCMCVPWESNPQPLLC